MANIERNRRAQLRFLKFGSGDHPVVLFLRKRAEENARNGFLNRGPVLDVVISVMLALIAGIILVVLYMTFRKYIA